MAVLIIAVAVSGCTDSGPATKSLPPQPDAAVAPSAALVDCQAGCWEPAVAVAPDGTVYVVAAQEPKMAVSRDGGLTFGALAYPGLPAGTPPGATQYDGYVEVRPEDGRLYFLSFVMHAWPASLGLQVAYSDNEGQTWASNVLEWLVDDASSNALPPWKSWIGFADDDTVYVTYNQRGTGIWAARSDDGGRDFGPFVRAHAPTERIISVFVGAPMVASDGSVFIPYFGEQSPNDPTGNPFLFKGHELRLAVSRDRGVSWQATVIASRTPPGYVGSFFPVLGVDGDDSMAVAYWDDQARVQVTASADAGASWSPPVLWSHNGPVATSPWLELVHGRIVVSYFDEGGYWMRDGWLADGIPVPAAKATAIGMGAPASGDFAHMAVTPDARVLGVWSQGSSTWVGSVLLQT